jgi:glycosyltransferase involved in cell wall biosynthesis
VRRLSLCYAAPGHALVPTAGTTRNMLSLVSALSELADVTLAFRRTPRRRVPGCEAEPYRIIAIEPDMPAAEGAVDDVATRGVNPFRHLSYLRRVAAFAQQSARMFDLVLEKGWRLSGTLLSAFRRHGVPGVLVENDVRSWPEPVRGARALHRWGLHVAAEQVAGIRCRGVQIIAETEELKAMLVRRRQLAPDRIEVVDLGVDHSLFRPLDRDDVRRTLGIEAAVRVLLYVGGMDAYHDLRPVIEALPGASAPIELHVVGDGVRRAEYQSLAAQVHAPARFHGPVPHSQVPLYIAAADLCLAPYRERAFHDDIVPFSTLKIPEYMACARPVVSVPSGRIRRLVEDDVSGFLFPNEVSVWRSFLAALPGPERLAEMGRAAATAVASLSWTATAARYLAICERVVALNGSRRCE